MTGDALQWCPMAGSDGRAFELRDTSERFAPTITVNTEAESVVVESDKIGVTAPIEGAACAICQTPISHGEVCGWCADKNRDSTIAGVWESGRYGHHTYRDDVNPTPGRCPKCDAPGYGTASAKCRHL